MSASSHPACGDVVVRDALKNLVRQFTQELCFYRELIQNAIDAGSHGVDVMLEYATDTGLAEIQVVDYGEGMDRAVIDNQLTRLFSSSKEDDYTKIGKFGIGFVSVFAIAPQAVVVETGKGGEHWRVLFKTDGEFERLVLEEPVEGTRVKLYKKMPASAFKDFVRRSRDTVIYWCRHASVEVRFQGEIVNQPFDLASVVRVAREEQGTHVVLGLTEASPAFYGFYNQGITLLEGFRDFIPGVEFKVKSRYLEHTLTRDNVLQDENYAKAMAIVERLVGEALYPELLARLEEAARLGSAGDAARKDGWHRLFALGRAHLREAWTGAGAHAPVLPALNGYPCSYAGLRRSSGNVAALCRSLGKNSEPLVLYDDDKIPPGLLEQLDRVGVVVLDADKKHLVVQELERFAYATARACDLFAVPAPVADEEIPAGGASLVADTLDLLLRCGVRVGAASWACFDDHPAIASRAFLVQRRPSEFALVNNGALLAEDQQPTDWPLSLIGRQNLILNARHPLVGRLAALYRIRPGAATYQLAKLLCLDDGIHPTLESRLARWALSHRGHGGSANG